MSAEAIMRQKHNFKRPKSFVRRDATFGGGLTLICACAGSGKTALLSQIADEHKDSIRISAGPEDNSERGLIRLFSEAVHDAEALCSDNAIDTLGGLISVMSDEQRRPLLIDNADVFTDSGAVSLLGLLADTVIEQELTMIAAAESIPPAFLRHIMDGTALLLGNSDLWFSKEQTVSLAKSVRPMATDEYISSLYSFTGGWCIAVSELLRTGENDTRKAADSSLLPEYIKSFILDKQDDDLRRFMLVSSYISGDEELYRDGLGISSAHFLRERLIRQGLAGSKGGYITYPPVMRHIMSQLIPDEKRNTLIEKASDHFISQKRFAEAIRLFEVSGNAQAAERILHIYGDSLLGNCEFELIGYCGSIIGSFNRVRSPEVLGALAQYCYYKGEYEKMEQAFNLADSMFGKENRFSVLRKLYKGLLRFELDPELYSSNVQSAVQWLNSNEIPLPFLYSRESDILERVMNKREPQPSSEKLCVSRFGGLRLTVGEDRKEIQCRTKRSPEIIAYILENGGRPVGRDELLNAFWYEDMPANAVAMLHNMIYHLRRELSAYGMENIISYKNKYYILDTGMIEDCDSEINEICETVRSGKDNELISHEKLLKSYWGSYLGSVDIPWANERREYYDRCYVSACTMLASHCREEGRFDDAVSLLRNAYRLDPYSEQLVYELLSCYSSMGKPDKAKQCYEEFCERLDAEFGTRPGKWLRNRFFSCFSEEQQ